MQKACFQAVRQVFQYPGLFVSCVPASDFAYLIREIGYYLILFQNGLYIFTKKHFENI
jgi:hypothetical protein